MCESAAPTQPTSVSQTTSNIPDWAIPYATRNLGQAEALTDINQNPYQTYKGERVAGFSPLQQQSFSNVAGMQTNAGTGNAMNQTQDAYNRSANAGPYNAQNFGNQYQGQQFQNMGIGSLNTSAPSLNQYQMGPAQQVQNQGLNQYQMGPADQVNSQNFGQQSAQDYMSPYAQQAIDPTLRENQRQFEIASTGRQAAATRAGAFGGSRQAIEQSEAQRNLGRLQSDTQAVGMQNAYQNAQQQFNADQARRQQSMLANQQAGLTTGQANLGSALQTQGLGAQQNLQSQLANQQAGLTTGQANLGSALQTQGLGSGQIMQSQLANQGAYGQMQGLGLQQNLAANQQAMQNAQLGAQYGLAGQQAAEQSRQFGANFGLQNNQQALAAAGQMGTLGQQQYAQQMGINAAQQQAGAQQQAQAQQGLSNSYQDFLNQQNYPYKQLGFMSDIMRGTPTSGGASSVYQAPPSGISQLAGLGGGLGSLYGAYNAANRVATGGEIKGYAEGGIVALAEGGPILPDAAEFMAAKNINAGKATVDGELGLGADLRGLLMASMQLKKQKEEDTIRGLQNQLAQATGMPSQQDTTVKEDVANMLRQEVESSTAENAPERQGGIAELDTGNLGENYNSGGIVAFSGKTNNQEVEEKKQQETDKQSVYNTIQNLAAAGMDIATLPGRGIAGAFESAVTRPLRAFGVPLPYLPKSFYGGDAASMTPYFDKLEKLRSGEGLMDDTAVSPPAAPAPTAAPTAAPTTTPTAAPPNPNVGIRTPSPAAESEDSGYTQLMKTLEGNADEGRKLLKSGIQPREVNKTAGEHAAALREQSNAYLKARNLPTAEESMKERMDNLATAGKEARNNRDVDRWMAAAQGFFTMAGGKSQYAMQNMAEGLGMGTKEFRAVEQDYRKVDQLQKDKMELLKEATRQEARGDFAKGDALRKEIDDRNTKIDAANVAIGERMTANAGTAMGNAIAAKGARDARRDAELTRRQIAAESSAERAARATQIEQGRTDRAAAALEQKFADMQVRLQKQHPLILKGTLPNKLTELENARSLLATNPKKPDFIKSVNDLTVQVDRMQDQVAMDTAKDAKRFIKAGNSEWGTLQTTGGTK